MIGYVTLGTNNYEKAAKFYDQLLGTIGAKRVIEGDNFIAWSTSEAAPAVSIIKPYDGKPATVGNGVMVAIAMNSTDKVDAFYKTAMALGSKDEGKPGLRGGNFYAAYFRDLDGNKLNAFCMS
jgi:catechol 2,3-dioxygenase-like lactoylglutathione lyase family enzyme